MARMVPSWIGISYFLPVRLSVMVSVSAISNSRLRRQQAAAARERDSHPRASGRDRPSCTARCRRAARPDRWAGGGNTRTQDRAAPCATFLFYLMGYWIMQGAVRRPPLLSPPDSHPGLVDVVPDILGQHHEDHVFGDVGGVVADAFEVPRHQDQVERRLDRGGILQHEGQQL